MIIKFSKIVLGILAIIIGLMLGPVPIIPGWPLVLIGIILISPRHKEPIVKWLKTAGEKIKNIVRKKRQ